MNDESLTGADIDDGTIGPAEIQIGAIGTNQVGRCRYQDTPGIGLPCAISGTLHLDIRRSNGEYVHGRPESLTGPTDRVHLGKLSAIVRQELKLGCRVTGFVTLDAQFERGLSFNSRDNRLFEFEIVL